MEDDESYKIRGMCTDFLGHRSWCSSYSVVLQLIEKHSFPYKTWALELNCSLYTKEGGGGRQGVHWYGEEGGNGRGRVCAGGQTAARVQPSSNT